MKNLKSIFVYGTIAIALSSCGNLLPRAKPFGERGEEQLAEATTTKRLAPPPTEKWKVIKVADGDTITVVRGNRKEKIRFCGIDAPEIPHGSAPGQPLGQESKANLQQLIDEAHGQVEISVVDSDRYGRSVAEVFTVLGNGKEKFLQEEQVKSGLAYHYAKYSGNCPNRDAIVDAEAIAKASHAGVWGGNYELPWDYRRAQR